MNKLHQGWENGASAQSRSVQGHGRMQGPSGQAGPGPGRCAGRFSFFPVKKRTGIYFIISHSVTMD